MQGQDTDRVHMGDADWGVECFQCGKRFEAQRSDATFCSPKCRVAHSREPQKLLNAIKELENMRWRVINLAEKYKGNEQIGGALEGLKSAAASAEYIVKFTD